MLFKWNFQNLGGQTSRYQSLLSKHRFLFPTTTKRCETSLSHSGWSYLFGTRIDAQAPIYLVCGIEFKMIKYLKEHMNKKVRHPYHIQGGPACLNARSILGHLWGIGCSPDLEFVSHILIVKSSQRDVANKRCQGSY